MLGALNSAFAIRRGPGQVRGRPYDRVPTRQYHIPFHHPSPRARYLAASLYRRMITTLHEACYDPRDRVRTVSRGHKISQPLDLQLEVELKPRDFSGPSVKYQEELPYWDAPSLSGTLVFPLTTELHSEARKRKVTENIG